MATVGLAEAFLHGLQRTDDGHIAFDATVAVEAVCATVKFLTGYLADQLGMTPDDVIAQVRDWIEQQRMAAEDGNAGDPRAHG